MRNRPAMDDATRARFLRACADSELSGPVIAKRFGVTVKHVIEARRTLGVRYDPLPVGDGFGRTMTFTERLAKVKP